MTNFWKKENVEPFNGRRTYSALTFGDIMTLTYENFIVSMAIQYKIYDKYNCFVN